MYVIPAKAGIQSLFPLRNALVLRAWPAGRPGPFLWIPAKDCGNDRGEPAGKTGWEAGGKEGGGWRREGREAGGKDGRPVGRMGVGKLTLGRSVD